MYTSTVLKPILSVLASVVAVFAFSLVLVQVASAQEYDFGGVDEGCWPGLTRFKKGFGGHVVDYGGAYEYPYKQLFYSLYRVAHFAAYRS